MPRKTTVPTEVSPAQALALKALLSGKSIVEAAAAAEVDRTTVHRWLRDDPAFIAEYQTDRAEIVGRIRRELATLGEDAVKAFRECLAMEHPDNAAVRLRAALDVLKMLGVNRPEQCNATTAHEASIAICKRNGEMQRNEFLASLDVGFGH
jgi:hypothetical protein